MDGLANDGVVPSLVAVDRDFDGDGGCLWVGRVNLKGTPIKDME